MFVTVLTGHGRARPSPSRVATFTRCAASFITSLYSQKCPRRTTLRLLDALRGRENRLLSMRKVRIHSLSDDKKTRRSHHITTANSAKRKRTDGVTDEENANSDLTDPESSDTEVEDDVQEYNDPKPKPKAPTKRNAKSINQAKKPRAPKPKDPGAPSVSQPKKPRVRKTKEVPLNGQATSGKVPQEVKIANDNGLFSKILLIYL